MSLLFGLSLAGAQGCDGGNPSNTGGGGSGATGGGGSGAGDTGGGGGDTGGGGGEPSKQPDGAPCVQNEECAGGFCLSEELTGWGMGYCSAPCNALTGCSDPNSTCIDVGGLGNPLPFCFKNCMEGGSECTAAQTCLDVFNDGSTFACFGGCTEDTQCQTLDKCDEAAGICTNNEKCDNMTDDDGDGLVDCEDAECEMACSGQVSDACMGAEVLNVTDDGTPKVVSGDTSTGTSLFAGTCTGGTNKEAIYVFTPASDGYLTLDMVAEADMGLYIRKDCKVADEVGCMDLAFAGGKESLATQGTAGEPLYIFVDGFNDGGDNSGPFTLVAKYEKQVCGDSNTVPPEECDDGNGVNTDTCTDMCALVPKTEAEPNGDDMAAFAMTTNDILITGAITPGDDEDWIAVTVPGPNSTISVSVDGFGGDACGPDGPTDTLVRIRDQSQPAATQVLAENEDIGFDNYCSAVSATGLAAGTYHIQVLKSDFCTVGMAGDCEFQYAITVHAK